MYVCMYVYVGRSASKLRENGVLLEQLERDGLQIRTKQNKTFFFHSSAGHAKNKCIPIFAQYSGLSVLRICHCRWCDQSLGTHENPSLAYTCCRNLD